MAFEAMLGLVLMVFRHLITVTAKGSCTEM